MIVTLFAGAVEVRNYGTGNEVIAFTPQVVAHVVSGRDDVEAPQPHVER